jgi:hypothetical protein
MPEQAPPTVPPPPPPQPDLGDLTVAINSLFMEDHSAGEAWAQSVPSWEEPYVAQDGTSSALRRQACLPWRSSPRWTASIPARAA